VTAQPGPTLAAAIDAWAAGDPAAAQTLAMSALQADPEPAAFGILGDIMAARGEGLAATAVYRAGLVRFPDNLPLAINFARLLRTLPDGAAEAVAILKRVVNREPGFAPARLSLIETVRTATDRLDEAERLARGYIRRFPDDAHGFLVLALTLFDGNRLIEADQAADRCLARNGHRERALELKANIRVGLGDAPGAAACYRDLIRDRPDPAIHSRLLMAMQYCDEVDEAAIFAETERWVAAHTADIVPRMVWPGMDFDPARRLRIGIVSRDFRLSALPYLAMPLFRHRPAEWSMTLYANVEQPDDWTARFRALTDHWVDIAELDDEAAAERIAADRIDVLFDINGHTLGGRPGLFARKPAPVQLAWLDYVGTTGLAAMDGIIGDPGHLPLADQRWYAEPIRHVAADLYRYEPPSDAPPVAALPAIEAGRISFGCFNSAYKLSAPTLSLWARILHALPSSKLILKSPEYGTADTRRRFLALFARHGIDPARLDLRAGAAHPLGMLAAYGEVDIALDPFPYSGGLTTLEALYMGVPVVTMPGRRFGSRHASVHLRVVGLDDWIAIDGDDYVALALRKAGDPAALAALRAGLRPRLEASPLCDGAALAADLARIVRARWQAVCRTAARR
jgi:protein O-GlcNAc transferase